MLVESAQTPLASPTVFVTRIDGAGVGWITVTYDRSRSSTATVDEVQASQPLLPATATFAPIEGGNHAQFGSYGDQPGDNPATISREEQQAQTVAATAALLASVAEQ